jgi:hypothetical protein
VCGDGVHVMASGGVIIFYQSYCISVYDMETVAYWILLMFIGYLFWSSFMTFGIGREKEVLYYFTGV